MRIGILGCGESGMGAALLSQKKGYQVFISDGRELTEDVRAQLVKNNIPFEERGHSIDILSKSDFVIKSPGIAPTTPIVVELKARGCTIISEVEWAYRHTEGEIIAVTGSNGKTTTTTMVHYLLRQLGRDVALVGNVGHSFCRELVHGDRAYWALEMSSFQLEDVQKFRPTMAAFLNLTADHLDRYETMERYGMAKARVWSRQTEDDGLYYPEGDPWVTKLLEKTRPKSRRRPVAAKEMESQDWSHLHLYGAHNRTNAYFAQAMVQELLGLRDWNPEIWQDYKAPEHRLEKFLELDGVTFINDSKATNLDATQKALEAVGNQVVLILGGVDKGNEYERILGAVDTKVRLLIALGPEVDRIVTAFDTRTRLVHCVDLDDLVTTLVDSVRPGDEVLLSPACASFDLFDNYEDRGYKFKQAIEENFGESR